jgi:branched-chain amino acid transport system permease protein
VTTGISVILTLGLFVVFGLAGEFMIGYAGIVGVGAYTCAILTTQVGVTFWMALPIAVAAAGIVGVLIGVFAARFTGHFVAIVTLAFNVVIFNILLNSEITRGTAGIHDIPAPSPVFGLNFDSDVGMYGLVWAIAVALASVLQIVRNSSQGYALLAIRDDPVAASTSGVGVTTMKLLAYLISGAVAGIGGALYASYVGVVEPSQYDFANSVDIVAMLLIGGRSSVFGAALGAILLSLLPEYLRAVGDYRWLIYSALLVFMMIVAPEGLIGLLRALLHRVSGLATGRRSVGSVA